MRGRLITLSGPDGIGKSTQARLLVSRLRSEGHAARTFWFRPGYSRELDRARALVRSFSKKALPTVEQKEARERVFRRPGVSRAWVAMALGDSAVQLGAKVRYWLARGEVVVCDRYLFDASLDLELRFPDQRARVRRFVQLLTAFCPRPDRALLLKAPPHAVEARLATKDEPFPDAEEVRIARRQAYEALEGSGAVRVIDAEGSAEDVHARLWQEVRSLLG